jgi:hypothetical protein
VDLAPWLTVGCHRQSFAPFSRDLRRQPQIGLRGVDLQNLPPEQPHQPVGPAFQTSVVHRRFELAQVVDQQITHPAGRDAVAVDQGLDRVLAGVALGRPRGP